MLELYLLTLVGIAAGFFLGAWTAYDANAKYRAEDRWVICHVVDSRNLVFGRRNLFLTKDEAIDYLSPCQYEVLTSDTIRCVSLRDMVEYRIERITHDYRQS